MFGIVCAPELFQQIMEMILSGCENCFNFMDDILIYGRNSNELKECEKKVLRRLKDYNVMLNHEKCIFGEKQVKFLGYSLSEKGITPTMDKIRSVQAFRQPKTAEETRSFLGLITFVGKFIPNLATTTEPLRMLTKKNAVFEWGPEQQNAFDQLKTQLTSSQVLGFYNVKDKTQLYADASPVGLGAVLIQFKGDEPRVYIVCEQKSLRHRTKILPDGKGSIGARLVS